jgi:YegS/Rv2252/BmrU family lipid kinase
MRVAVIVNPSSGGGRAGETLTGVTEALTRRGVPHRVQTTTSLDHARELAREAAAAGEVAAALGGDGLVGAVAGALIGTHGILGVLPGGRGNDFARALGIPFDAEGSCAVLTGGHEQLLDIGDADGRTFIGIGSCGFDSDANKIANETTFVRGNLVYAYAALRALAAWRPATFTVEADGHPPRTIRGYTIAAANSTAYGGGMMIAPNASMTDGLLDVVMIPDVSKLRFVRLMPSVFKGEHVNEPGVEVIRTASVRISADRPFTMYADGDPIAELPVTVRAIPGAVRVVVPGPR